MAEQRLIDAITFEKSLCDEAETFLKLANELAQYDPIQALKNATKCGTLLEIAQKMFATPSIDSIDSNPVVHAHWIERFTGNEHVVICSYCANETNEMADYHLEYYFCPHCGSRMDEWKDGEQGGKD